MERGGRALTVARALTAKAFTSVKLSDLKFIGFFSFAPRSRIIRLSACRFLSFHA
jgi:hypothetical protein